MFEIDGRLVTDTLDVMALPLCRVRLMNDHRYPWLILIPQRQGVTEVLDLTDADQLELWREVTTVAAVLRERHPDTKLNIGTLGNVVPQLHVHIVGRHVKDPAWPGPVWGHSPRAPYAAAAGETAVQQWRLALQQEKKV